MIDFTRHDEHLVEDAVSGKKWAQVLLSKEGAGDKIHGYDDGEVRERTVHATLQGTANDYF